MSVAAKKYSLAIALVLLLWLLLAVFTYSWLVPRQINFDFYSNWVGAHEMLRGENPYAHPFTDEYLAAQGYPNLVHRTFKYPATITWILLPFWIIPAEISVSLWSSLQTLLVMLLPLLVFSLLKWRVRPLTLVVILLASTIGNYHTVNVYAIGQFTIFILACVIVAWWQALENRPWLVALAILGATIRPDGAFIAGAMLLDLLLTRRYKPLIIWTALMGTVVLVTLLQVGFWIPKVVQAAGRYHYVARGSTHPPEALGLSWLAPVIAAGAIMWGLVMFWQMRELPDRTRLPWRLSVAMLAFLVILPQTHDYTLVYAFLPIWFLMWVGRHSVWTIPVLVLVLFASWVVYAIGDPTLSKLQQLLSPVFLGGLLTYYWQRQRAAHAASKYRTEHKPSLIQRRW